MFKGLLREKGTRMSEQSEEAIPEAPKTVKVKGLAKMKYTSTLEYYFENKRRSGGGNHTMEICEEDEDIAYFTFETHEVAKAVSQRSHRIEGVTLSVSLYNKPKPPPQYDDRVFIKGVKSTTTKDCLFNFLEAKSGCTPQSLVHGEKEGDILVVFESVPDFDKLDHISKTMRLEGASLKMSRVPESNCVLVSDLPSNTTRDTVQFYFENYRRSGGGTVLNVEVNQEDGSMIVFFEDYKVAEAVSQRSHKIGEATIKVDLYLPCIGRPHGDVREARFKLPEPLVITGIAWQKIKFLLNSSVNKVALDTQLERTHSKIIWPKKGYKLTELTLECMLTPDMKDCRKLAKGWSNCTKKSFVDFIRNILLKILSVISDVWDKVMSGMANLSIANPEAVIVFVDRDQGNITIVGLKHAAESVIHDIGTVIQHVEEAEKEKQKVKETITNIELIKTKMLLAAKFQTKMEEKYIDVKVKIHQMKNEIILEGLLSDVRGVKVDMYEMINEFAHVNVNMPSMKAVLYQSKNVKEYIVRQLKSRKVKAVWEVEDSGLVIYTNIQTHILICKGIIEAAVKEQTFPLTKASRRIINSDIWRVKFEEIQAKYEGKVWIEVSSDGNNIHICATDDIVKELEWMVNGLLNLDTRTTWLTDTSVVTVNTKKEDQHMEVSGRKRHVLTEKEVTDSDEIFEQFCDPCKEDNKEEIARGFCKDCNEYLCDACFTQHKRPRPFRHHVLQEKREMPKHKPAVETTSDPSICDKHGEEIKFYCKAHDNPCCGACATSTHKTCDVRYLEDEFREIQNKCDEIDKSLDKDTKTKDQNMKNIGEHFSYSCNAIAYFRKEVNDFFDKLEAVQINQATEIKTEDQNSIESMSSEFGLIKDDIKLIQQRMNDLYKSKQNVDLFSAMDEANTQLKQLSQRLNKLSQNNKIRKCQFIPEKKIRDMIKEVGELGKLYF